MRIRFLVFMSVVLILLACAPPDWQVVRGAAESGPPQEVELGTTPERVYNCGLGGDTVQLTTQRSVAIGESVQWEVGSELEASFGAGAELLAKLGAELGVELEAQYGKGYAISAETGTGWQLPARPGEWIEYTIRWSEVWQPGEILLQRGNSQQPVYYRLRRAIRSEIVDKKMLDCDPEAVVPAPAATPIPAAEPSATATLVAPASGQDFHLVIQGIGFAPVETTNPSQRRSMALLAAQMDAKRNLAVWLAGEDVEAVTVVENGQVTEDVIRREVSAWLVGVYILSEEYDEGSGQATVEIAPALGAERP